MESVGQPANPSTPRSWLLKSVRQPSTALCTITTSGVDTRKVCEV